MAYVSVISLSRTLEQLVQRKPHWISDETRKMVDSLLDSLEYFQEFLENTNKRRQHCEKVAEFEKEIRTAVNEAEDVIELKIYEIKQLEQTIASEALCETLPPLLEKISVLKRNVMGSSFGTNEAQGDPRNEDLPTDSLPVHSSKHVVKLNAETIVVGLEDDLMIIISRLKGPVSTREIIPILGMGGIGKTTLAKKAYDDLETRHRFDIHVWVTVSQEYRIRDMLLDVLRCTSQLTYEIEKESDDRLMDMIRKKLMNKRYLVVMDDIWSIDVWDLMTRTFPDDNNGSRIILTSRLKDMAMHADPESPPHEMRLLDIDGSWKLLHDKVFGAKDVCPPELEDIGKQVAQKCQGLPLALLVVAGHLSKIDRTRQSWEEVAKSVSKVVADEPDNCLGVLAMSYNYLPNHLKPCFLYMGVFPEDSDVNAERLINLWVSEGFLPEELMGRDCLEDLVSRNLVMIRDRRLNGEMRTCGVHDLVRDLILEEADKERFLQVTRTNEAANRSEKNLYVRRYSFHSGVYQADFWESSASDLIRTVHFFRGLKEPSKQVPLLEHFKLLRVLAILQFVFDFPFPHEITKLVHLRYLEVAGYDDLHWISELYNLQTLIFHLLESKTLYIPVATLELKQLRHLHVSKKVFFTDIPSNKQLKNLERLSYLSFSSCTSELFSAIPNLKSLKIHGKLKEFVAEKNSQRLNSFSPLRELEMLKIRCYGATYYGELPRNPRKYALPTSLRRLTLAFTYLPWEEMTNIVKLPNLEVLKIKDYGFYGKVWRLNGDETFNQLKFLLIHNTNLEHWEAGNVNFPMLQRLVLISCYCLNEVPNDFGEICTLESIELHACTTSSRKSVEEIQEEQQSMGNDCLTVLTKKSWVVKW